MSVRVRFAPSPTGYLHVGGLRTALYCYLFAKKHNGKFLLRIEDTDQERLVTGSLENLIETLNWAGLNYDEGPVIDGPHASYIQSERLPIYREYAMKLLETEHGYRCFCTKEETEAMRQRQIEFNLPPKYDGRCRNLTSKEIEEKLAANMPFIVRQAIPAARTVAFEDVVRGRVKFETKDIEDQVLLKSDGFPTYHLASVVDDHLMEITHVIRGEEWLPSTPKHILLYEAFGWQPPVFVHLPLILNADRTKLSKRQNDVSTESYKQKGYLKEAILNFIALLGWSTPDNREVFSVDELVQEFSLERIQKSGAVFDLAKLDWFNWQWRRRLYFEKLQHEAHKISADVVVKQPKPNHFEFNFTSDQQAEQFLVRRTEVLLDEAKRYLSADIVDVFDQPFVQRMLLTVEEKFLQTPRDVMSHISFYLHDNLNYSVELFAGGKADLSTDIIAKAIELSLEGLKKEDFASMDSLRSAWIQLIKASGIQTGQIMLPCRVALTAEEFSPGTIEVAWALGYEKSRSRFEQALAFVKTNC